MSCFVHFNTPIEELSGKELLQAEQIAIGIARWDQQHPESRTLNDQYKDLICFEPELTQLMKRVPMMERLGRSSLSTNEIEHLKGAIEAWQPLASFYKFEMQKIEKLYNRNMEYFEDTEVDRHKAGSLALMHYEKEIGVASTQLRTVVSHLLQAGFSYSAMLPCR